jgi:hypothetical protein
MQTEVITPEQVVQLAARMPCEQLAQWYPYGLSMQAAVPTTDNETALREEFAMWEAASDEDWLNLETQLAGEK